MPRHFCIALLLLAAPSGASPLFDDDSIVDVELRGPIDTLIRDRLDKPELSFQLLAEGKVHDIELRPIGKSRLKVCGFPLLRFDFDKDSTAGTIFEGQNKLKVVTHCRRSPAAHSDVVQEYLVYRIFTQITDAGYRTRLLRLTYTDTDAGTGESPTIRYGFAVEPRDEFADRLGGDEIKADGVTLSSLDDAHMARVYVFQYLVGNTDWSLAVPDDEDVCCHNGNILEVSGRRFYVPYDFDQAGIVNARHARPDPSLRLANVRRRRYRGFCMERDVLLEALRDVRSKRPAIMAFVDELPALSARDVKTTKRYLDRFFAEANDEEKLLDRFERRCIRG